MKRTHNPDKNINVIKRTAILVGAIIIALALALTFALGFDMAQRVSVDNAGQGEVETSATAYTNLASGSDKSAPGALVNGDTLTYTTNTIFSLKLPAGTYTLEAWGGQGGYGYGKSGLGGYGGYTKATYKITAATTIYIVVGGAGPNKSGSNNTIAGGYNGGGSAISKRTCSHGGGGGGGATHFATATGQLSALSGNQAAVLLVAGGGGGAGNISTAGGMGGGTSTTAVYTGTSTTYGIVVAGGTVSSAKGGSTTGGTGGSVSGSFGKGGNSSYSSNYCGGAGGGAGWYGGGGGALNGTCAGYPGGGGSSFVKSTLTSPMFQGGQRSGSGQAKITVVSVNQNPTTKNANIGINARGNSTSIAASSIATDPEGTGLAFTANTSTNFDTLPGSNAGLWLSTGASASKYFDWNWTNGTLNITNIKYYPRSGIDGSTVDGQIKLYTYVRDSFGTSTTRGTAYIPFTVTVGVNSISRRGDGSVVSTVSGSTSANKLHFGMSKTATAPSGSAIDTTNIYNPLGTNRYTAVFEQPIRYNEVAKINVSDLVLNDGKAMGLDKIVASINSVAAITGTNKKFSITEYDANSAGLTAYNSGRTKLANVYDTLSFKCVMPDPAYQVLSLTIYRVENNTVLASPYNVNVAPGIGSISLDIVFKMDNTRPVIRNDKQQSVDPKNSNTVFGPGPLVKLQTLSQVSIKLNDFYMDVDGVNNTISSTTHQIVGVSVPEYEYVQINKYGEFVSTKNTITKKSYFNVLTTATTPEKLDEATKNNAISTGQLMGDAYKTGFDSSFISNGSSETVSKAYIQYSFSNDALTLTGLRASYSRYKDGRTNYEAIVGGNIDKLTTESGVENLGHFYILVKIQDRNDTSDNGIWLPLGIEVTNKAPTNMQSERNGAGAGEMPTASGEGLKVDGAAGQSFYFTPMGITVEQKVSPIGLYMGENNELTSDKLRPIASDADNYFTDNMLNGLSLSKDQQTGIGTLNELLTISSVIENLGGSIQGNNNGHYFTVEPLDIYIPSVYFAGRVSIPTNTKTSEGTGIYGECVVIKGLKITLNKWTHNRYINLDVEVADCVGRTGAAGGKCTVQIAVNVNNHAPTYLSSSNVAQLDYITDGVTVKSTLGKRENEDSVAVITYNVPVHSRFIVSPYDLLTDADMVSLDSHNVNGNAYPVGGFTLNGLSGIFNRNTGEFTVNSTETANDDKGIKKITAIATSANKSSENGFDYSDGDYIKDVFAMLASLQNKPTLKVTTDNRFSAAKSETTWREQLYFTRTTDANNLDGFTYNPYAGSNANAFTTPEIAGRTFVSCSFGSKIVNGNTSYNVDYAVIEANQRTASNSPSIIEFDVRDRTGAGGTDKAYGIKKIRVEINVINSSPYVKSDVKPVTLSTKPIDSKVTPSTITIKATDILDDREDGEAAVRIDTNSNYAVVDAKGLNGSTKDSEGRSYAGNYVKVSITQSDITVTALNSTQAIPTLYIRFYATDGRYNESGELDKSVCYIRIQVVNAKMGYNTGENGFEEDKFDENSSQYLWNVESITTQDMERTRYFVSGSNAAAAVRSNYGAASGQIKYVVSDTDALQGVALSPAKQPENDSIPGYVRADITNADKLAAYRKAVPQLSIDGDWASDDIKDKDGNVTTEGFAAAALLSMRSSKSTGGFDFSVDGLDQYVDITDKTDIIYFVKDGDSYTSYYAKTLKESGSLEVLSQFFDEKGRWMVTDWAIAVNPLKASSAGQYINLRLSMRDDVVHGGDTAGLATAYDARNEDQVAVLGNVMYSYNMFINGIGIVASTYYNQFNGYYTVADAVSDTNLDAVNGGKVYVPTYDGTKASKYDASDADPHYTGEKKIQSLYYAENEIEENNKTITKYSINSAENGTEIKTRKPGGQDNTNAGVHSGIVYSSKNAEDTNGFKFTGEDTSSEVVTESAFKYSDTITISADGKYTYIPMSYFALRKTIAQVNGKNVTFDPTNYVSYDVGLDRNGDAKSYARISGYVDAVTISDGLGGVWSGGQENPYVSISGYDLVYNYNSDDAKEFNQSPYFNHCLSIPTCDVSGYTSIDQSATYTSDIVGDNGRIMYLADQDKIDRDNNAYGLQEHLFGLKIKKNATRAQSASLTITIKVVECERKVLDNYNTMANYDSNGTNTAEITLKLEIGNSHIKLVGGTAPIGNAGFGYDTTGYYYTEINTDIESGSWSISLSRDREVEGSKSVITYDDADFAYKMDSEGYYIAADNTRLGNSLTGMSDANKNRLVRDDSKSDQAKFAFESIKQLKNLAGYTRVIENNNGKFTNVLSPDNDSHPQASITNYFNDGKTALSAIDGDYRPNGGIYAQNDDEGFERYFSVGLSADGTKLSITPKAKTIINSDMISGDIDKYYKARGLKYVHSTNGDYGYYPLKVLIYDDHGDGFGAASYVALEIRVTIKGTAAKLSDNLVNTNVDGENGKKIDVSLGIDKTYSLNISHALVGGSLIKGNSGIFWKADYDELKGKTGGYVEGMSSDKLDNLFKLESGTYLISPFDSSANVHGYGSGTNFDDLNKALREGNAVYSSNPTYNGIERAKLADVIMYMAYYTIGDNDNKEKGELREKAVPTDNLISFRVNRRTTYKDDNGFGIQNSFTFVLRFKDSDGNTTAPLCVNIEVVNQAPTIYASSSAAVKDIKMKVGDSFTVLTTPYNRFVGSSEKFGSNDYTTLTASAKNSETCNSIFNENGEIDYRINGSSPTGVNDAKLLNRTGDDYNKIDGYGIKYQDLTENNLIGIRKLDCDKKGSGHLGYIALADDDMPWGLRIYNVSFYTENNIFSRTFSRTDYDRIKLDREIDGIAYDSYPLSVVIKADSVCRNMPITFTVIDSDGSLATLTMNVTVESSAPTAIEDDKILNPALNLTYKNNDGKVEVQTGVYQLYMISNNVTDQNDTETIDTKPTEVRKYKTVNIKDGDTKLSNQKAYGKVRIPIKGIASDTDTNDKLLMYAEEGNADYNVVLLNNSVMSKAGNTYSNGYLTVEVASDYSWFTIECKSFNPNLDTDVLSFRVRDDGNNVFENSIPIQIRINTLYSSITNDAQMTNSNIVNGAFNENNNAIASVFVKSFDDYSGLSKDLPADEEELAKIVNVDSTFQFLEYNSMPDSVDQTDKSAKPIIDPDVVLSNANLNYELSIYAFLDNVGESASEFEALDPKAISALFNLSSDAVRTRVLALKSDTELRNSGVLKENETLDSKYLIGGSFAGGTSISTVNRSLVLFLQRYFMFDIGDDGVSLRLRPISANLDVNIPVYVQIRKTVDRRNISIEGVNTVCGDIFYVKVLDSAPIENTSEYVKKFTGKVGDSVIFKMYDKEDPFGSLFTDSDLNDVVTYVGYRSATVSSADYDKALAIEENEGLDWKANESTGKPRAVEIEYNNTDKEVDGIPAYSIKVTINRRLDLVKADKYLDEVPLTVMLPCKDRGDKSVSTKVEITIQNSNIDIDKSKLGGEPKVDNTNGYYMISADPETDRLYYIDAYVSPTKALAPFYFVSGSKDQTYISDPDFKTMTADIDSMRLVGRDSDESSTYLMYEKPRSVLSALETNPVATVTPIFGSDKMANDKFHFAGFSIETYTTNRRINDATATMRIIDRSGDATDPKNGFTVTVRIHILNVAPTKKNVDNKPFVMTGSDTKDGTPVVININDYITDINSSDKVRIVGLAAMYNTDPNKEDNLHCSIANNGSTGLVDMSIDEKENYKCSFTYKKGYYGEQTVSIMVADILDSENGDQYDYSVVDFRINFVVGYDISETKLNDIEAIRSLPTKIDVEKLFGTIKDTYEITDPSQAAGEFNPGADYVITDVTASGVKIYKDGDDWMFISEKESDQVKFNVTFKNKYGLNDPEVKSVAMSFNAIIGKNTAPELLQDFKNHTEEGYLFQTSNRDYGLDNNGTVTLTPQMLFSDKDIANGDKLTFDPKSISVSSPTICSVRVSEDGTLLYLTFNCRGECDFTVGVMDSTGETTKSTFKVKNIDRPDPSFWNKLSISYEESPLIWWGAGIGLLILILLIILIIVLVKHRKRKQEELEAILISEMELEEQMMRLNAGAMGAMPYQSYGYLPPTMNVQNDPNLMLGGGGAAPDPGAIGLNPGAPNGSNGVPTDSDM